MPRKIPKDGCYNLVLVDHKGKQPSNITMNNVYLGELSEITDKLNQNAFISFYFREERYIIPVNRIYEIQEIQLFVCESCGSVVEEDDYCLTKQACYKCLNHNPKAKFHALVTLEDDDLSDLK